MSDFSREATNENGDFEVVSNLDSLSEFNSNPEVAEGFIQIISDLSAEQKMEKIESLLSVLEENNYRNLDVAKYVADTYWGSNERIMKLIEDESYQPLFKFSYYGPVEG